MDDSAGKRKAEPDHRDRGSNKKFRGKQKWNKSRNPGADKGIQPGDVGIWVTCAMNKEAASVSDLRQLFENYASKLYADDPAIKAAEAEESGDDVGDIESEIQKEIQGIKKPTVEPLFRNIKLPGTCLIFIKTRSPVEPVSFVHKICQDTADGVEHQRCRYVKRLTPLSAIAKATINGLEEIAVDVLKPHFHEPDQAGKKFAIRVSIRNNKQITRDEVIQKVASIVGKGHKVDLAGYDHLILVEINQGIVGMSVVGSDYDKLKKYNMAELRDMNIPKEDKEDQPESKAE